LLKEELKNQEIENYKEGEINWLNDDFFDSWDKVCGHMKKIFGHKTIYEENNKWKPFFIAHSHDVIKGKPLLIQNTKIKLPLIRRVIKKEKDKETKENIEIQSFYMLGEKFDRRYDGFQRESFALDFYQYQVITPADKKFYVFSEVKLPSETSTFKGMILELDDFSEISRTMKLPQLSGIFFVKESEPAIKTLEKEELVNLVKKKEITVARWLNHLAMHPYGTMNLFPQESELLTSAQLLSGKFDGYPLHITYFGPQGTRKTMGKGETLEWKFSDKKIIVDSGNSRLKGLGASYKWTITDPGYLAKQQRIAIVDEIGKMVEREIMKVGGDNALGDLNAIMEHKERKVVSGSTSESNMKPTAKFIFLTNPINSRRTLSNHVGLLDPTFMSRGIWWVQDKKEIDFVLGRYGILRTPKDFNETIDSGDLPHITLVSVYLYKERKKEILLKQSFGVDLDLDRDLFLTIFDSCYAFNSEIDNVKVQNLVELTSNLAKEPMRSVWKPRAFHHVFLLVDGLCKQRCLFRDHDATFTAKQEDYDLAERILIRMVNGWETDLSVKTGGHN